MGYRGDDLDLRTPHAAPGDPAISHAGDALPGSRSRAAYGGGRSGPIWVDDTVLDCCNHAFDVAAAHRSAEVRLEHLVYALTRIDEANDALEQRAIRTAALRREAATAIATEIPASLANGKTVPRRAEAFEEVLRLAASHAYRRQAPVSVADIIHVLFDSGIEFAGLQRLLPAAGRSPLETFEQEIARERSRGNLAAASPSPRSVAPDLTSLATAQAFTQHARIDAIEQSIRTLTSELTNERKILSGVLQDLQRELMAQREDTSRLGGITHDKFQAVFGDRLQSLEQAAAGSLGAGELQERLTALERTLTTEIAQTRAAIEELLARPAIDMASVTNRLEVIEAALAAERERAEASEELLGVALEAQPARILDPLNERLDGETAAREAQQADTQHRLEQLEATLSAHAARSEVAENSAADELSGLRELLGRLGETLAEESANGQEAFVKFSETLNHEISELHVGLGKVNGNQHTLAATLDTQGLDAANAFATLAARIDALEQATARPVEMLQSLSATVDKMHRLTVERYYRRNRFWYWLFGTDDWLAASWPSQSARIAEELRSIKH